MTEQKQPMMHFALSKEGETLDELATRYVIAYLHTVPVLDPLDSGRILDYLSDFAGLAFAIGMSSALHQPDAARRYLDTDPGRAINIDRMVRDINEGGDVDL